ncbi:metallophosphoesterase family protein [Pelistega ratti]|nr:metallophosphoesterase [Pelistega ratti]
MMNANDILFFGDTHGGFYHCLSVVEQIKPKAIIFLGDLQAQTPLHDILKDVMTLTDVWWIHGNHDTDSVDIYDNLFESQLADKNLHGRVATIAGWRIAGLGGVFRGKIWTPIQRGWSFFSQQELFEQTSPRTHFRGGIGLKHRSSIFPETYMALRMQKSDILVSHEAPSCNRFGFLAIDRLARQMEVKKIFHGHHHDTYDYSGHFSRMHFEAYAVGYRGVSNLAGEIIRSGEMDGEFSDRVAVYRS